MSKYRGCILNGPHQGLVVKLEKYSKIVEIQFDETCAFFGYEEEDITNGTYVKYNAVGPYPCPGETTYYVVDEEQDKILNFRKKDYDKNTSHSR